MMSGLLGPSETPPMELSEIAKKHNLQRPTPDRVPPELAICEVYDFEGYLITEVYPGIAGSPAGMLLVMDFESGASSFVHRQVFERLTTGSVANFLRYQFHRITTPRRPSAGMPPHTGS